MGREGGHAEWHCSVESTCIRAKRLQSHWSHPKGSSGRVKLGSCCSILQQERTVVSVAVVHQEVSKQTYAINKSEVYSHYLVCCSSAFWPWWLTGEGCGRAAILGKAKCRKKHMAHWEAEWPLKVRVIQGSTSGCTSRVSVAAIVGLAPAPTGLNSMLLCVMKSPTARTSKHNKHCEDTNIASRNIKKEIWWERKREGKTNDRMLRLWLWACAEGVAVLLRSSLGSALIKKDWF